mgnify:CR=1 FL=1
MLVLNRRKGESVNIYVDGDHRLTVIVLREKKEKLSIGFEADRTVHIVRAEIDDDRECAE